MELVHLGWVVYVLPGKPSEATFVTIFAGYSVVFGIVEEGFNCPSEA
jgi:hypothetical protein